MLAPIATLQGITSCVKSFLIRRVLKSLGVIGVSVCSLLAYDSADMRLQVDIREGAALHIQAFRKETPLFDYLSTGGAAQPLSRNGCTLRAIGEGYELLWENGSDSPLSILIHRNGNIILENACDPTIKAISPGG